MISIIIPTYNRPETLKRVLPSYFLQKQVKELIVIDDASTRDYKAAVAFAKEEASKYQVDFIYYKNSKKLGAAGSRNIGISKASGELILWGEDDAFLSSDYTEVLIPKIKNKEIVFGNIYYGIVPEMPESKKREIITQNENRLKDVFDYRLFEGYYGKKNTSDIEVPFGHALIMLPASAYENCRYFEEYGGNGYREESDAQVQLKIKGYKIIFTSETCCYHLPHSQTEMQSGQHTMPRFCYEFYKIKNTFIFYNRFYAYFKSQYHIKSTKTELKLYFIRKVFRENMDKAIKKIRGRINVLFA